MYERILLAYDGSRDGLIALREGALLAKAYKAHVFLLSVLPETTGLGAEGLYGDAVGQQVDAYKALLERGVTVAKQLGLQASAKMVIGEPAPQSGAHAKEMRADLVVLGHRRKNMLQRWWSGGTSAYITVHVTCSVLIGRNAITDKAFERELASNSQL